MVEKTRRATQYANKTIQARKEKASTARTSEHMVTPSANELLHPVPPAVSPKVASHRTQRKKNHPSSTTMKEVKAPRRRMSMTARGRTETKVKTAVATPRPGYVGVESQISKKQPPFNLETRSPSSPRTISEKSRRLTKTG